MTYEEYKKYYEKNWAIKSPYFKDRYIPKDLQHMGSLVEYAKDILKTTEIVDIIDFYGVEYSVYYEILNNKHFFYFINKQPLIGAYFFYKKEEYGSKCFDIFWWNTSLLRPNIIIIDYFLPLLKNIYTKASLKYGNTFIWKDLIKNHLNNKKYEFGIIKDKKFIIYKNLIDFDGVWNNPNNIKIYAKLLGETNEFQRVYK